MYAPFELDIPTTLDGALAALANGAGETVLPIAGGTNLIVDIRAKRERPDRMVGLGEVDELLGMEFGPERISIGGRTTVSDLLRSPEIAQEAPSLIEAARLFGGLMVRNTGTVAGNIASGSPAADLVPPLLTLDAELTLASTSGTRTLALDDYYPRLQAGRAPAGRADHPDFLAAAAGKLGEHLLQARTAQGRCHHRHRRGGCALGGRRHLHQGADRARVGRARSCAASRRRRRCSKAGR